MSRVELCPKSGPDCKSLVKRMGLGVRSWILSRVMPGVESSNFYVTNLGLGLDLVIGQV